MEMKSLKNSSEEKKGDKGEKCKKRENTKNSKKTDPQAYSYSSVSQSEGLEDVTRALSKQELYDQ